LHKEAKQLWDGFKLHIIINEKGEILSFLVTPGNVADINVLDQLSEGIKGKLFGDKGYISSKIFKKLLGRGLELFTTLKSNMKQKMMKMQDKILLRKRSLIETVNDQLKNISQIEHTRHRSVSNFLINNLSFGLKFIYSQRRFPLDFLPFFPKGRVEITLSKGKKEKRKGKVPENE